MNISSRIFAGFFGIVGLLAVVAGIGLYAINNIGDGFVRYRALALQTNNAGRVQANMLLARMNVKNFIIHASEANIKGVQERAKSTLMLNDELVALVQNKEKKAELTTVSQQLKQYLSAFNKVTELQAQRNDVVLKSLDIKGPQMERKISAIMKSAKEDNDADAAYRAGLTLRELLLARLYATKYLVTNETAAYDRVNKEMAAMTKSQQELLDDLQNFERRKLASEVIKLSKDYAQSFVQVHDIIDERNDLIKGTLDSIGPQIADKIEQMKLGVKAEQDKLGPEMTRTVKSETQLSILASIIAAVIAVIVAFLIGRSISKPILLMTTSMQSLANGELETEIPGQDRKDEIRKMAEAVQIFKENAIERNRLESEQEQLKTHAENEKRSSMNGLADKLEGTVSSSINLVSQRSRDILSAANGMGSSIDKTASGSMEVAEASIETSADVQTVASATTELASSIQEISRQVDNASEIAGNAVKEANDVNIKMQGLNEAAQKIGDVVNMITDIAEQTNLLALNATIEAARAGDAGKGFAVVASEVKNLANQTAKATDEIGSQISKIQTETSESVEAIESITDIITKIDQVSTSISAAVEEQGAATGEIARTVERVNSSARIVADRIAGVTRASAQSYGSAIKVIWAAQDLEAPTQNVQSGVDEFLKSIRT